MPRDAHEDGISLQHTTAASKPQTQQYGLLQSMPLSALTQEMWVAV